MDLLPSHKNLQRRMNTRYVRKHLSKQIENSHYHYVLRTILIEILYNTFSKNIFTLLKKKPIIWKCSSDTILDKENYIRSSISKRSETYRQFFTDH